MKESELVEKLVRFGLEEKHARAYYRLARLGSATASDLAEATSIHRTQIYDIMEELEEQGFAESTLERPRRFVPRPVEDTLEHIIDAQRRRVDQLEETWDEIVDAWPQLEREDEARQERFTVHHGRTQIKGALERIIDDAEEEILAVVHRRGLGRWDSMGVLDDLHVASENGVSVRALTEIGSQGSDVLERFARWAEVRHHSLPGYSQFIVKDTDEIALFVALDPVVSTAKGGETVLWLNASDFILSQKALFDLLWSTAVSYGSRVDELETGEPAPRVEVVRGRWMRYDRVREMLSNAGERIRVALPEEDVNRLDGSGMKDALEHAAQRGVEVSVLAPKEIPLEGVSVSVTDLLGDLAMVTVDGNEALVGMGLGVDAASMTSDGEWGVWSSMPSFIDHVAWEMDVRVGRGEDARLGASEEDQSVEGA